MNRHGAARRQPQAQLAERTFILIFLHNLNRRAIWRKNVDATHDDVLFYRATDKQMRQTEWGGGARWGKVFFSYSLLVGFFIIFPYHTAPGENSPSLPPNTSRTPPPPPPPPPYRRASGAAKSNPNCWD